MKKIPGKHLPEGKGYHKRKKADNKSAFKLFKSPIKSIERAY